MYSRQKSFIKHTVCEYFSYSVGISCHFFDGIFGKQII